MVIITWKQKEGGSHRRGETYTMRAVGGSHRRGETYTMRAVVKPINARTDPAFVVEREHTDAAGGKGWVPANHTHATAIICKALLQLAEDPGAITSPRPVIDLGLLDLPEE